MPVSRKIAGLLPSVTLAISDKARRMKAAGINVVGLSAGEPDFDTPDHIKEAAIQAIRSGLTKYTASSGTPELRRAVADKFQRDHGLTYAPEEIVVSVGAKHSCYNVIQTLCDEGDEVVIPAPYWVSYPEMVRSVGGRPVIVHTKSTAQFKITPEDLERACTDRTKLFILNSPGNPTGSVYTEDELRALAETVVERGLFVLSDEIYEKLIYDGRPHVSFPSLGEAVKERTLLVNGASKAYAMTGWRIGYTAGRRDIMKALEDLQSQTTSNPSSISQAAALAALTGTQEPVERMRIEFERRRDAIVEWAQKVPGWQCARPGGAFYIFPNVAEWLGRPYQGAPVTDSVQLAEVLLQHAHVAVVPGTAFGGEGHLRLSYACGMATIDEGMRRIVDFFTTWKKGV